MILATVTTRLRHLVRLVHASTGRPITGLTARLEPAPHGWSVRALPDAVVVVARDGVATPPAPLRVAITVTTADPLVFPLVEGQPPRTVVVDLTSDEIEVPIHPVPMTLTVVLTTADTGEPSTGLTVTARATSGPNPKPTIDLPEVEAGVYRSAAVEWTSVFTPLDLLVGGSLLRTISMDLSKTATRVHLLNTT